MTDLQAWVMSVTVVSLYALTMFHSLARYAIMRATERYISLNSAKERDQ